MSSASDYLENALAGHIVGKTSFTMPTAYVALWTTTATITDASDATAANEANYTGYARESTAGADWNAPSGGLIDNANDITFGQNTGASETMRYMGVTDNATRITGNMLVWDQLPSDVVVGASVTPEFLAGALDITVT